MVVYKMNNHLLVGLLIVCVLIFMMVGKKMKLPKKVEKYSGFIMVGVLVLLFFCMSKKRVIEGYGKETADEIIKIIGDDITSEIIQKITDGITSEPSDEGGYDANVVVESGTGDGVVVEPETGADVVVESGTGDGVEGGEEAMMENMMEVKAEGFVDYPW